MGFLMHDVWLGRQDHEMFENIRRLCDTLIPLTVPHDLSVPSFFSSVQIVWIFRERMFLVGILKGKAPTHNAKFMPKLFIEHRDCVAQNFKLTHSWVKDCACVVDT